MEFHEYKAFTKSGIQVLGNPASVVIVDQFPADAEMGAYAKQLASPMTTFVQPTDDSALFNIRHFSPDGDECHICGHATMAATAHMRTQLPALAKDADIVFNMNPKFGVSSDSKISVAIRGDNISLTMPAIMDLQPMEDPEFYKMLCDGLNVAESDLMKPVYFAPRIRDLVVAFKDPDVLLSLNPNFVKLKDMAINSKYAHEGLMGTAQSNIASFDVINRVFLPGIDVNEDIACGSGNCSVIPFWATKSKGVFAPGTTDYKVVYPYPPGEKGYVGGIQHLHIDTASKHIVLTGEASFAKSVDIQLPAKSATKKNGLAP